MNNAKLDPEKKARWIAALRSGKYTQGRQCLRHLSDTRHPDDAVGYHYCCLGVLTDLAVQEDVLEWNTTVGAAGAPPAAVAAWALGSAAEPSDPVVIFRGQPMLLSTVNDRGASFAEIADIIEEQL